MVARLAEADAFAGLGLSRREALWEARALAGDRPLPLFAGDIDGDGFDEIITGFRLALGGGQELFGVTPDIGLFGKALELIPDDGPSRAMAARCRMYRETPPPEGWDCVYEPETK